MKDLRGWTGGGRRRRTAREPGRLLYAPRALAMNDGSSRVDSPRLLDSRRLTGPNPLLDRAGAVIEVAAPEGDTAALAAAWEGAVRRLLAALGWSAERTALHLSPGGAALAITAPLDALYAATEVNEAAWEAALAAVSGAPSSDFDAVLERLRQEIAAEANPRLVALQAAAEAHGLAFLADGERATAGLGTGSRTWDLNALPTPEEVDWSGLHDVPTALVTGTNGKTTTVRMLAEIVRAAGKVAGTTSTDRVMVGDEILDRGDYSGPNGARLLLRDRRVEVAILETARGGLLRRGLALARATAAAVTNVAEDHLGEFGVADLAALAATKLAVARGLRPSGTLVLNADDPELARQGELLARGGRPVVWFSLDPESPLLRRHLRTGGEACWLEGEELVRQARGEREPIAPLGAIPSAFGGAARHNVANALAAAALAAALGLPLAAQRAGLTAFLSDPAHNPGRANRIPLSDCTVLLDYAHNPHGVNALRGIVEALPAARRIALLGQAGDRSDEAIRALAHAVWELRPAHLVVKEMPELLRGRPPGEVPALLAGELRRLGAPSIEVAATELAGVRLALQAARPGDLLVLLVHSQREAVLDLLDRLGASGWKAGEPLP